MSPVCSVPQSGMIVPSACLFNSVLENKHRYNARLLLITSFLK
jgi:hypothetical protein